MFNNWIQVRKRSVLIAGMSIAITIGVGIALVLDVFINYLPILLETAIIFLPVLFKNLDESNTYENVPEKILLKR